MKKITFLLAIIGLFLSCSKESKCPDCQNGGICEFGECDCPVGYGGELCQTALKPTNVFISSVQVTKAPQTNNGSLWDSTSGPDIYIIITNEYGEELYNSRSFYILNSLSGSFNPTLSIMNTNIKYTISLHDYDGINGPDETLGAVSGYIWRSENGFPDFIAWDCSNCKVGFVVNLLYLH